MVHEGVPGLINSLGNSVKVTKVYETKDHYLKDYTPYVEVKVKGRLNPEHWKIIQAQKGMIVLDVRCGLCDCLDFSGAGNEQLDRQSGFISIALTPIDEAYEREQINDWVDELDRHVQRARGKKPQVQI